MKQDLYDLILMELGKSGHRETQVVIPDIKTTIECGDSNRELLNIICELVNKRVSVHRGHQLERLPMFGQVRLKSNDETQEVMDLEVTLNEEVVQFLRNRS